MSYSLRYYKDIDDKPTWFAKMIDIGPTFTSDPNEAARFDTEDDARESPCYSWTMGPVRIVDAPVRTE